MRRARSALTTLASGSLRAPRRLLLTVAALCGLLGCAPPSSANPPAAAPAAAAAPVAGDGVYTEKKRSPDGIGKVYMGREISFVMGHQGADWLERPEREQEEQPAAVIENMQLAPDAAVADIGAGTGYFSFRIAAKVPQGRVLAVDIQPEMLELLEKKKQVTGIANVEPVLGTIEDPKLPENAVDAALLVDAYHEFSHPREMMQGLVRALRPGGRVFLVEYRAEDPTVPIKPLHRMSVEQARRELEAVGLRFVENKSFLPWQHFLIFEKAAQ
jgi:SAM-dependent methyltransferase